MCADHLSPRTRKRASGTRAGPTSAVSGCRSPAAVSAPDRRRAYFQLGTPRLRARTSPRRAFRIGGELRRLCELGHRRAGRRYSRQRRAREPDRPFALIPAYTFVATAIAVEQCGYRRISSTSAPTRGCSMSTSWSTNPLLSQAGLVVPVAAFGRPVAQEAGSALRRRTGIPVVIDAGASFEAVSAGAGCIHRRCPGRDELSRHQELCHRRRRLCRHDRCGSDRRWLRGR